MRRDSSSGKPDHEDLDDVEPWDAHDSRRRHDHFAPPSEPCECFCLHCRRTFCSDQIWFQKINGARDGLDGFWMCPTPNCGGAGFTFDIFPTDPSHPANEGWFNDDGEEIEVGMKEDDDANQPEWLSEDEDDFEYEPDELGDGEYDPSEPQYQMMDQWGCDDEDMEGEEWKYGLEPGERPEPVKPDWVIEEEKKYDQPDQRPRELDWSDMERPERGGAVGEDDIPF